MSAVSICYTQERNSEKFSKRGVRLASYLDGEIINDSVENIEEMNFITVKDGNLFVPGEFEIWEWERDNSSKQSGKFFLKTSKANREINRGYIY